MRQTEVPIVLARRPRRLGEAWTGARSWFGGLPRLGQQAWPRGKTGVPLIFVAQIDLGELAAFRTGVPMPTEGSLAFFVDEGAVVYVPPGTGDGPTEPPADLPPAFEHEGDIFPQQPSPFADLLFPYWPISFAALDVGNTRPDFDDEAACEASEAAMAEAVTALFPGRGSGLWGGDLKAAMGADNRAWWWRAATLYLQQSRLSAQRAGEQLARYRADRDKAEAQVAALTPKRLFGVFGRKPVDDPARTKAEAVVANRDQRIARLEAGLKGVPTFLAELEAFCAGHDESSAMSESEAAAFDALYQRRRTEFGGLLTSWTSHNIAGLNRRAIFEMAAGSDADFAALPPALRDIVNSRCRVPQQSWHQMFGRGVNIQGNPMLEYKDHFLLLQLVYDDVMSWQFGDVGAFQFYMSDKDLELGNWAGCSMTFECH